MTKNRNGSSGFAKGLAFGSLLGGALALLSAPKKGKGLNRDLPGELVRSRSLPAARGEEIVETVKPVRRGFGWLVIFYVASAVAMFSDLRRKKTQSNSYD